MFDVDSSSRFPVRGQTDKQTDKQTRLNAIPQAGDYACVDNNLLYRNYDRH